MARIVETTELPVGSLVIGTRQVRVRNVGREIDELAQSIAEVGLLEPIVVCPGEAAGTYEIVTGQRRFLAHKQLGKETILASVLDEPVSEVLAKTLSLTENLVRTDLNRQDMVDVCNYLYKRYGTMKAVAEETGLPYHKVRAYVKYERLKPELKNLVDHEGLDINVALRAQDAASATGYSAEDAVKFAKEMAGMSGAQQRKLVKDREANPDMPADELVEEAKSGAKITQILVTLGQVEHQSLQQYASKEGTSQDDAAAILIHDGLLDRGYLGS